MRNEHLTIQEMHDDIAQSDWLFNLCVMGASILIFWGTLYAVLTNVTRII